MKNSKGILTASLLLLALSLVCQSGALAGTVRVGPGEAIRTIQAGIDAASDGDTVLVGNGTYRGAGNKDLDFKGKRITVKSLGGPAKCVIDCEGEGRGFTFHRSEKEDSVLSGFTITRAGNSAIYCDTASPTIEGCILKGNRSKTYGGGISCYYSSAVISRCIITDNTADMNGGQIRCNMNSPVISGCTVSRNSARWGGGIYISTSSPVISDCTVSANRASLGGAGLYSSGTGAPRVKSSRIIGNKAIFHGGGFYAERGLVRITDCTFTGNMAGYAGGGIHGSYLSAPELFIDRTTLAGNVAGYEGGGISGSLSSDSAVTNSTLIGNRSKGDGGGMVIDSLDFTVTNCVIARNEAEGNGGGIWTIYSKPKLTNCTIADNTARGLGGGSYSLEDSSPTLFNCILWNNEPTQIDQDAGSKTFVTYSDVQGGYDGDHNLDLDPMFVQAPAGDYHLSEASPCVNAGRNDAPKRLTVDRNGGSRIVAKRVDLGAYEVAAGKVHPVVSLTALSEWASEPVADGAGFRIARTGSTAKGLTVGYAVVGRALSGIDYKSLPGVITLRPGESDRKVALTVLDDSVSEEIESVTAALYAGGGYEVGWPALATVNITDDD